MERNRWKPYLFWIVFSEAVGALAAFFTRNSMELYRTAIEKPPLSPPAIVFPIVWAILYLLMGVGAARVWIVSEQKERIPHLIAFLAQLSANFLWSIVFFNLRAFGAAFFVLLGLWVLILWMIVRFRKIERTAALLQIPYLVWVTFAGYLNLGVWLLNR